MQLIRHVSMMAITMSVAGSAWALAGPKVAVTYSMEERDGGRFVQQVTGTPLGAGDAVHVISIDDDCKGSDPYGLGDALCGFDAATNVIDVLTAGETAAVNLADGTTPGETLTTAGDQPMNFTIEYTATGAGVVVAGPVQLVGMQYSHYFEVSGAGGLVTSATDNHAVLGIGVTGTYDGIDTITWDGPWAHILTGSSNCGGSPAICSLAVPPGGWPEVESGASQFIKNGNPAACPDRPGLVVPAVPTFEIGAGQSTADSNNGSRDLFTDDILMRCGNISVTYHSWYGVETSRTFTAGGAVPILGFVGQLALGGAIIVSGGLAAWRRGSRSAA